MIDGEYVIVVDDDPSIQAVVGRVLELPVIPFHTLDGFLSQASRYTPRAVFLDVFLGPENNGLDAVPKVKGLWPYCPLLVMTSASSERWIVEALEAGADDFISKPLNADEIRARLNVRTRLLDSLRRVDEVMVANLKFSHRHSWLDVNGKKVFLSPVSGTLMKVFAENADVMVSRETLHRVGWPGLKVSENALDQRILEIRRALSELGSQYRVHCIHGEGYFFAQSKPSRKRS